MRILLIDDDAFLRDMYATKFTQCGDSVQAAENGHEALSILAKEKFDVILLDMVMPGMSGIELMTEIRKNTPTKDTKCIVLSNQGEESDMQAATEAGADGYIIKAESIPSEVVTKVHNIVS